MNRDDIEKLVPKSSLPDFASAFLLEFLKDGFGSATKRSSELHIFHLLEKYGNLDMLDNTTLSHILQITETRVKSYRYESKLRFKPVDDKYVERRVLWCLARSQFDSDSKRIKFIIEDPYISKALSAESKRLGGVPDTSFNSEVVQLKADQLLKLIEKLYGQSIAKDYAKDFKSLLEEDSKIKFSELRKRFVLGAAGAFGGSTVKALKAYFTGDPT